MKRRDFLRTAGGAGAATAATAATTSAAAGSGVSAIQDEDGNATDPDGEQPGPGGNETDAGGNQTEGGNQSDGGGLQGSGNTQTIEVGPGGDTSFDPSSVEILPGTEVVWDWDSDNHNVVVDSQPGDANWEGQPASETFDTGYTYSYTFTVEGEYAYYCDPHLQQGMEGTITVSADAGQGGGGEYEPPDPSHMGIPVQKHFVGAIAFMGVFVTLVFTFYLLKYGESAHTAAPNKED